MRDPTIEGMRYYCGHYESFYFAYRYGATPFEGHVADDVGDLKDAVTRLTDFNARELIAAGLFRPKPHSPGCLLNEGPQAYKHHLLVRDATCRASNEAVVRHRWNGPVPEGAFWRLSDKVYVSTPEFTFLQLSGVLTSTQLALVGCALVSPYYLDHDASLTLREPLTTPERLGAFLESCPAAYGSQKAARTLPHLTGTLKSPLDLHLWARFCFPWCLGGMGLPPAQVNSLVAPCKPQQNKTRELPPFVANLYWRQQHAAIKVLEELSGPEAIEQLLELRSDGLNIVSLSYKYLKGNERYMDVTPGFFEGFKCLRRRKPADYGRLRTHLVECLINPDRFVL